MGFIMKDWMARHGLGGRAASLVLGTSEATVSRAVHGVAGNQLTRTATSLDGLVVQLSAFDQASRQIIEQMVRHYEGVENSPPPAIRNSKLLMGYRGDGSTFEWDIDGHILAVGPSGSGHTANLLLPNFERYKGRMVVIDCKDEITDEMVAIRQAATGRRCVVAGPRVDFSDPAPPDYVDPDSDVVLKLKREDVSGAAGMLADIASEVTADQPAMFWFDHDTQDAFWVFNEFVGFLEEGGDDGCTIVMCLHHLGALDHSILRHFTKVAVIGGGSIEDAEFLAGRSVDKAWGVGLTRKPNNVAPVDLLLLLRRNLVAIDRDGTSTKLVKAFPQSLKDRHGHHYPAMADVLKEGWIKC